MLFLLKEKPYVNYGEILMNFESGWRAKKPLYFRDIVWKNTVSETQHKHASPTSLFSLKMLRDFTSIAGYIGKNTSPKKKRNQLKNKRDQLVDRKKVIYL